VNIAVVTSNRQKAIEIAAFFRNEIEIEHISIELPEPRLDDIGEIARNKAEYAFQIVERPLIVDDTAFSVSALQGFPGPFAAYVHATIGNAGILKLLDGMADRRAYFETAVAFATKEGILVFRGRMEGVIVPARGMQGFGYDPIFEIGGQTLAEMSLEEKSRISHRALALSHLKMWILSNDFPDKDKNC
jgi:XTP/dITP diphosphohydrolase